MCCCCCRGKWPSTLNPSLHLLWFCSVNAPRRDFKSHWWNIWNATCMLSIMLLCNSCRTSKAGNMHKSRIILPSQSARLTPFAESQKLIMQSSADQAGDAFMGCFRIKHIIHSGQEDHRVLEALGVSRSVPQLKQTNDLWATSASYFLSQKHRLTLVSGLLTWLVGTSVQSFSHCQKIGRMVSKKY